MSKLIIVSEYIHLEENTSGYLWNAIIKELEKQELIFKVITLKNVESSKIKNLKVNHQPIFISLKFR